jgi:hypothetical protein
MDDLPQPEEPKLATEAPEQGAIRGAFLARASQADATGGGGFEGGAASDAMRGAYLRHLTAKPSGAVVGDESSDNAVRSTYAARSAPAAAPARKQRARPAKAAKKKRAAASRPRPAKRAKPVKRAQPIKRAKMAKPMKTAKHAKTAKRAKKAGRKTLRR